MLQLLTGTPTVRMPKDSDDSRPKRVAAVLEQYRIQHACLCVFGGHLHLVCSCLQDLEPVLQDMGKLVYYKV